MIHVIESSDEENMKEVKSFSSGIVLEWDEQEHH